MSHIALQHPPPRTRPRGKGGEAVVCQVGFETLMDTTDRALPWVNLGPKTSPFVPPPPPSSVFMGKKHSHVCCPTVTGRWGHGRSQVPASQGLETAPTAGNCHEAVTTGLAGCPTTSWAAFPCSPNSSILSREVPTTLPARPVSCADPTGLAAPGSWPPDLTS